MWLTTLLCFHFLIVAETGTCFTKGQNSVYVSCLFVKFLWLSYSWIRPKWGSLIVKLVRLVLFQIWPETEIPYVAYYSCHLWALALSNKTLLCERGRFSPCKSLCWRNTLMLPLLHLLPHRCHFYITIRLKSPHLPVRLKLTFTQKKRTNELKSKQGRYHLACYFGVFLVY